MCATLTRRRQPKPLACTVLSRPVCPCELMPAGQAGVVAIDGHEYAVSYHAELPASGEPVVRGYRVEKLADPTSSYDLPADLSGCECMGNLRWGRCKHVAALRFLFGVPAPRLTDRFAAETI